VTTRFLTPDEVADRYAIPKATLYRQRSFGDPPGCLGIRVGRHIRFDPRRLEAWERGDGPAVNGTATSLESAPRYEGGNA
jgi:hypothetical protein